MAFRICVFLAAAAALPLAAAGRNPIMAPIPSDPLELVTGHVRAVHSMAGRAAALELLARARESYALRDGTTAFHLEATFTVDSGGVTAGDGEWQMEDWFDPNQGLRWTASNAGYQITRIVSHGALYSEQTGSYIPLRLQEARSALFSSIPSARMVARASIRTSTAVYNGAQVTCVLLSAPGEPDNDAGVRRWDETEECIDPQTGLLQTHSQVPGRYFAYDYSNAPRIGGHVLPRQVTVTEGGKTVSQIRVVRLTEAPAAEDATLFAPTEEMKAKGRAITMAEAQKVVEARNVVHVSGTVPGADAVCIFGVVTPWGQLAEAHSLQPADPNSAAALESARQMSFERAPLGPLPEQHFVFIIETFAGPR